MTSLIVCPQEVPKSAPKDTVVLVVSEDAREAVDACCNTVNRHGIFVGSASDATAMAAELYDYKS